MAKRARSKQLRRRLIIAFWGVYVAALAVAGVLFFAIAKGAIGYMPPIEQLANPIDKYASVALSSDGQVLGSYAHSRDNRIFADYKELSPDLVKALIATEDVRFARHSGIDIQGLLRAIIKRGLLLQKSGGGGSTITQQLAKQLYSPSAESVTERLLQKPIEWVIAVKLERYYTKEEIINLYLNQFDFLYNAVGVRSAARVYFAATPQELKTEEAATLIGMCKNPSYYNPVRYNERSRQRRNIVLRQMAKAGYLTAAERDSLSALPLVLRFSRMDHKEGLAPYFREYLRVIMTAKKPERSHYASWQEQKFADDTEQWENNPLYGWCNKNRKADGSFYNLYTDGLKIHTTLDARMQRYAEEAVTEHIGSYLQPAFAAEKRGRRSAPFSRDLTPDEVNDILTRSMRQTDRYRALKREGLSDADIKKEFLKPVEMSVFSWKGQIDTVLSPWDSIRYHKSFLHAAFMAMDPRNGQVKAYVGGVNYGTFQYDMVTGGRRQIGSTMKPFLYSLAMIEGISPCDKILHVPQQLIDENGRLYSPRNADATHVGEIVTIQWGLQHSSNWVTAYLMKQLSPYTLADLLHSFGIRGHIDPVVALCLGTPDISVSEMVGGYSAFANKGIRVEPLYVTHIEDSYGNTVATFNPQMREVLPADATYKMLYMLRSVIDGGTGNRVRFRYQLTAPMGGKTGTTQNYSDGWFMGFTPNLVAGCWVGGEDRAIHFDRLSEGQGANMALPIYGLFMQKVYADSALHYSATEDFDVPPEYADPCDPSHNNNPPSVTGIDRMFQ